MRTYVITVARQYPVKHIRQGEETRFIEKISCAVSCPGDCKSCDSNWPKIHTGRKNYEYWKRIVDEVNAGNAILSVRYWSGKPRKSKQVEIVSLDRNSGIGIQKLIFENGFIANPTIEGKRLHLTKLSRNDGLEVEDFLSWFERYDLSEPLVIIHFTTFRY